MIKFEIEKKENDKKLIAVLQNRFPKLSTSSIYKALRNKDIRINEQKITENVVLHTADEITLYIKDEILFCIHPLKPTQILYEDLHLIIVNKPKGVLVQSTDSEPGMDFLINQYLKNPVTPAKPCHRLDRNTSGLLIFAKDFASESAILQMLKDHCIQKYYRCLVAGYMPKKSDELHAYLFKDSKSSNVIISNQKKVGYREIITRYTVLKENPDHTTWLQIELITGRTHQIRAHLAFLGHPIIGDGKYGSNEINKKFHKNTQELESYQLVFTKAYEPLSYLEGKKIKLSEDTCF